MKKRSTRYKVRLDMRKVLVVYYTRRNDNLKRSLLTNESFRKFAVAYIQRMRPSHKTQSTYNDKSHEKSIRKYITLFTPTFDGMIPSFHYKPEQRLNDLTRLNPSPDTDDPIMSSKELSNLDYILECTDKKVMIKRMRLLCKKLHIRMKDIPNKSTIEKYKSNIYFHLLYRLHLATTLDMRPCDTDFILMLQFGVGCHAAHAEFDGDILNTMRYHEYSMSDNVCGKEIYDMIHQPTDKL